MLTVEGYSAIVPLLRVTPAVVASMIKFSVRQFVLARTQLRESADLRRSRQGQASQRNDHEFAWCSLSNPRGFSSGKMVMLICSVRATPSVYAETSRSRQKALRRRINAPESFAGQMTLQTTPPPVHLIRAIARTCKAKEHGQTSDLPSLGSFNL